MRKGKKFLSAALAAFICFSVVNVSSLSAFAEERAITDGIYIDNVFYTYKDIVPYFLFETDNEQDMQTILEKALINAIPGKNSLLQVTFEDLQKLTGTLDLSGGRLKSVKSTISELKDTDIGEVKLTDVPACINYMTNLRTLNLSDNLLKNEGLSRLDLLDCTKLTNINLSKNFLTRVPSWFINSRVTTRNISQNFITGENPRSIKVLTDEYYFVNGETFDQSRLKTRILDSVRFNDNSLLPDFLFDYDDPPYDEDEVYDKDHPYPYELDFDKWDFSKFIDEEGNTKVDADTFIDVTVCLFKDTVSDNTKATVRVYLLDGRSASSINQRLTQLLADCKSLNKSEYTEASWQRLDSAQQSAVAIQEYTEADMEMLSNALNMLSKAYNTLERAASTQKKTLDALVKVGSAYKEANYTPQSWAIFKAALDQLKALQSDKNATSSEARRAIKAFQKAQSNLANSALNIPGTAPKSDFEQIYGEDKQQTYNGIMLDGKDYNWTFKGVDVVKPIDFKPEVQNTNSAQTDIMMEVGSASRFRLFSTVQTGDFPGKATLSLALDDEFADGTYYLYKWDTSSKGGKMMSERATVSDHRVTVDLSEGGVYYICSNVRNFDLKSSRFKIDDAGKRIILPLLNENRASELKNSMEFGSYVEIRDENGDLVSNVSVLYDGMTVNAPGGVKYTLKKSGDMNNDGSFNINDITSLLETAVNGTSSDIGDVNGDGRIDITDVTDLLNYFINL